MDFQWSEEQKALRDLAKQILDDRATHDRLTALEAESDTVFDPDLWAALADAGILGVVVPHQHGGAGLTLLELLLVLEEAGSHVAPVPLVPTVTGALALDRFASDEVRAAWLPRVATGDAILTAALEEEDGLVPDQPRVQATQDGDSWHLAGERAFVPYAVEADGILVPATTPAGPALFLVTPGEGVVTTALRSTNRAPLGHLVLDGAPATLVTADGAAAAWLRSRAQAAWCAVQAGVCQGAVAMMAAHTSQRRQFGKPIAEFQAVSQRAADAFIDAEMVRLTAWQAIFRVANDWEADKEVASATFWAGDGAMRVVHAAQHLHGGLGVDVSYPVHRFFLWAKQIEHTLGTPTRELRRLGVLLASEPV